MSKLLLDERPLIVLPKLATIIGLNESIFTQQIHYLLTISNKVINGATWTYNTYDELQEMFPFWSNRTIKTIVKNLKEREILLVEKLSKDKRDKTNWYSINYIKLDQLSSSESIHSADVAQSVKQGLDDNNSCTVHSADVAPSHSADVAQCIVDTKTTTKTTTKNIKKETKKISYFLPDSVDVELFSDYLELRKTLKAPNTQRAINGLINKLNDYESRGHDLNSIISTAYENGWKSFYEPRPQFQKPTNNTNVDFALQHNVFDIIEGIESSENTQGVLHA